MVAFKSRTGGSNGAGILNYDSESVEIGWVLEPSFWGLGIASCLTSGMIAKARNSGKQVVIECVPEQKSSIRIAEKYGFQSVVLSMD